MVDKINILIQMFIKEHEAEIDEDDFDKIYSDAYIYFKDDADIGSLTEIFKSCGMNPEEYFLSGIPPAFAYQTTDIEEIKIRKNIVRIGGEAFYRSSLKKVTFEEGSKLKHIGMYAFRDTLIEEVYLPEGVEQIASHAFANCEHLRRIYIPDSVINITYSAFFGSENVVIECHKDSRAHHLAVNNEIEFKLI